jgi:hypothetical protein
MGMEFRYLYVALLLLACGIGAYAANTCGDTNNVCTFDANITADMNWIDGNTYVITADINITGTSPFSGFGGN